MDLNGNIFGDFSWEHYGIIKHGWEIPELAVEVSC
jgi:hypothetical protein